MPQTGTKGLGTVDGLPGEREDRATGRNSPGSAQAGRPAMSASPPRPSRRWS
ncbi:hypothetical protein ACIOMM_05885 [Streptomyces sp. NPDC087908]|uniref:hypothetical protein n=1 Tax=Streptomyces sp. NPDC087908 TaxID=3365820 RepID=UPI0037F39AE5